MSKDGGGNWNRAARKSGGDHRFNVVIPSLTWEGWMNAVRTLILSKMGIQKVEAIVPEKELREWYDAGERPTWAAVEILKRA